jgi:rare lipoprotein A
MRSKRTLRAPRAVPATAGALILAVPGVAIAADSTQADAHPGGPALTASLSQHEVGYGRNVVVSGMAPGADAGQRLALEFKRAASRTWREVASATTGAAGGYRFRVSLPRSGMIRVAPLPSATVVGDVSAHSTGPSTTAAPAPAPSDAVYVAVRSKFRVGARPFDGAWGQAVSIHGSLFPAVAGQTVRLLARVGNSWTTVARAQTGAQGGFDIRYAVPSSGDQSLRVAFDGDRYAAAGWASAGQMTALHPTVASWYDDGGNTACGFHAYYGVANKTLPCGTKVTFSYGGRSVVATVDDRGPYVAGRSYDLNQNTAAALGMGGVATVLASI